MRPGFGPHMVCAKGSIVKNDMTILNASSAIAAFDSCSGAASGGVGLRWRGMALGRGCIAARLWACTPAESYYLLTHVQT